MLFYKKSQCSLRPLHNPRIVIASEAKQSHNTLINHKIATPACACPRADRNETSYVAQMVHKMHPTWHKSNAAEYKAIVEKLGPKLKCVHQQYKSMKAKFPISIFQFQRSVNAYSFLYKDMVYGH